MKPADNMKEAYLKREVLDKLMKDKNELDAKFTIEELLNRLQLSYGIGIKYKGFAQLLQNKSTWKLVYAFALCDYFDVKIQELFELR